jgi:hypothetical protein
VPAALPVTLRVVLPELQDVEDHRIAGKATVPAAELLELLLRAAVEHLGHADRVPLPLAMKEAAFPRFLPADEVERCSLYVTLERNKASADVRATLASRIALAGAMRRSRVHAVVTLGAVPEEPASPPDFDCDFEVPAERIYRDLITFGPRYCNLRGTIRLGAKGGTAIVRSPQPPRPQPLFAGCPYLFDAAMHLACVWGQRYAGYVAYPTGFTARILTSPISAGERRCIVAPTSVEPRRLLCDLWLTNDKGEICDTVLGLAMSPLATGAPPPPWIVLAQHRP